MTLRGAIPLALLLGLFPATPVFAQVGYDLFATPGGGETFVMLPLPGGGSMRVELEGNPGPLINRFKSLDGTNVDTIVRRMGPPQGTVPIELIALSLKSIQPIELPGMGLFDVFVRGGKQMVCFDPPDELCPPPPPNPLGQMTIGAGQFTSQLPVQAQILMSPRDPATGQSQAMSFFDVFVTLDPPGQFAREPTLRDPREDPMVAREFPAGGLYPGATEESGPTSPKVAVVERAPTATHVVIPANTVGPSVLTCFYECKDTPTAGDTALQETTTLMILNQNPENPAVPTTHLAHVVFFDGNERARARSVLPLSGRDLDELHVCKTIDNQTAPGYQGPPAGLVKIAIQDLRAHPTPLAGAPDPGQVGEGVVAWIKDILGKFQMTADSTPEPFGMGNSVIGLGKTRCELADPRVINARDIFQLLPQVPLVPPVLVERTNDVN